MKKSLRQMVLVGLSTSLLASVAVAPVVWAQDDASESTEQVGDSSEESSEESTDESAETSTEESSEESTEESSEGSMEESSESTTEESVTEDASTETSEEVAAVEASLVQQGVEEAIAIFQEEYPDAEIEEIDVELDRDADDDADADVEATEAEDVYQITISGFDAEDNDFELEIEWVNGAIREQAFNEGMFNTDTTDSMDTTETTETTDTTAADTETSLEETSSESMSEESVEGDTSVVEETPATDEATERRGLDLEALITLDEAVEIATAEYGEGQITNWNLTVDDPEWYEFWEDGYENPIWTIDIENENETDDDKEDSEIRIDAVSGDIINLEDIDSMDSTESSSDTETSSEESSE